MRFPAAGEVIAGTGGLRKLRFTDRMRSKGKRGGLRVIDYWWVAAEDEAADLTASQRKALSALLNRELKARSTK